MYRVGSLRVQLHMAFASDCDCLLVACIAHGDAVRTHAEQYNSYSSAGRSARPISERAAVRDRLGASDTRQSARRARGRAGGGHMPNKLKQAYLGTSRHLPPQRFSGETQAAILHIVCVYVRATGHPLAKVAECPRDDFPHFFAHRKAPPRAVQA